MDHDEIKIRKGKKQRFIFFIIVGFIFLCYFSVSASDETEQKSTILPKLIYENGIFHFYAKNYVVALNQFLKLINQYPAYETDKVHNYHIATLSHLNYEDTLQEELEKYSNIINQETFFVLIDHYQEKNMSAYALDILRKISSDKWELPDLNKYHYYAAITLGETDYMDEAFDHLNKIKKENEYYIYGCILQSRFLFKMGKITSAVDLLTKIVEEKKGQNSFLLDKAQLLTAQMLYEKTSFNLAAEAFKKIKGGLFYPDALVGLYWTYYMDLEFDQAANVLLKLKKEYPVYFYKNDLAANVAYSYILSGNLINGENSLQSLKDFFSDRKKKINTILNDDRLSLKFSYYILHEFFGYTFAEYFKIPEEEKKIFRLFNINNELINSAGIYFFFNQIITLDNFFFQKYYSDTFTLFKRKNLYKNFVTLFRQLRSASLSLEKEVNETKNFNKDVDPQKNLLIESRKKEEIDHFSKKFNRDLTENEKLFINLLVYDSLTEENKFKDTSSIIELFLFFNDRIREIYEKNKMWSDDVNIAATEHNKTVLMYKKLKEGYLDKKKELQLVQREVNNFIISSIKKEASDLLKDIDTKDIEIQRVMTELNLEQRRAKKGEKNTASEFPIGSYKKKDSFRTGFLLNSAQYIYDEELKAYKNYSQFEDSQLKGSKLKVTEQKPISFSNTINFLNEVLDDKPHENGYDELLYLRSYCYQVEGDYDKAVEGYLAIKEKYPQSSHRVEVLFRIGEYYFDTQQFDYSIENYESVLKYPASQFYDKALYKLGWAYFLTNNYANSIQYFEKVVAFSEKNSSRDKKKNIEKTDKSSFKLADLSDEALKYIAISYAFLGDGTSAIQAMSETMKPHLETLMIRLGEAYFDQAKYLDYRTVYESYFDLNKKVPEELEVQDRLIAITTIASVNEKEALEAKEKFIFDLYPGGPRYEENKKINYLLLEKHLKEFLTETTRHYHEQSQNTKSEEIYIKANNYYAKYLGMFGNSKDALLMTYRYADTFFELGKYKEAAEQFALAAAKITPENPLHEKVLYGAITSFKNYADKKKSDIESETDSKLAELEEEYLKFYSKTTKSGPIFFRQGQRHFEKKDYDNAIISFEEAIKMLPDEKDKITANEYIADSLFNKQEYYNAEKRYKSILEIQGISGTYDIFSRVRNKLGLTNANIAGLFMKKDHTEFAARRFEIAASLLTEPDEKESAFAEAMKLYSSLRDWKKFNNTYHDFKRFFPDSTKLFSIVMSAGKISEENFDYLNAGMYYEMGASITSDKQKKLQLILASAYLYKKGNDMEKSTQMLEMSLESGLLDTEQELEMRFKVGELLEQRAETKRAYDLYRQIVSLHEEYSSTGKKGNIYYNVKAKLKLLETPYNDFTAMELVHPFKKTFLDKMNLMDTLIKGFQEIIKFEIIEFSTLSLLKMGNLFDNFKKSIMDSKPPAEFSDEEKDEYKFMLEEKAYPFEKKSIDVYNTAISIGRKNNITNKSIDECYLRLAEISPAIYKREEEKIEIEIIPIPSYVNPLEKIDLKSFEIEEEEEEAFKKE